MGAFYDRTCWNQRERELKVEKKGALEVWSSNLEYKNVHSVRISSRAMHLKLYQRKRCRFPQRESKERDLLSQWKLTVNLEWDESWRKEKRWRMICPLKREGGERGRATCPNFPPPSVPSKFQSDQDPLLFFLSLSFFLSLFLSCLQRVERYRKATSYSSLDLPRPADGSRSSPWNMHADPAFPLHWSGIFSPSLHSRFPSLFPFAMHRTWDVEEREESILSLDGTQLIVCLLFWNWIRYAAVTLQSSPFNWLTDFKVFSPLILLSLSLSHSTLSLSHSTLSLSLSFYSLSSLSHSTLSLSLFLLQKRLNRNTLKNGVKEAKVFMSGK